MLDRVKAAVHKRVRSISRLRDSFSWDHDKDADIYAQQQRHQAVRREEKAQRVEDVQRELKAQDESKDKEHKDENYSQHPAIRPLSVLPVPRSPTTAEPPPQFVSSLPSSITRHKKPDSTGSSSSACSQTTHPTTHECLDPGKSEFLARPHLDHHHSCHVEPLRLSHEEIVPDHERDVTNPEQLHYKLANLGLDDSAQEQAYPRTLLPNTDLEPVEYRKHAEVDFDHTVHNREAVTHETIKPHVHTIYEPKRTRSIHVHEHKKYTQPIVDPEPTVLPAQHWAEDHRTGKVFTIPDELGRELMQQQQQQ